MIARKQSVLRGKLHGQNAAYAMICLQRLCLIPGMNYDLSVKSMQTKSEMGKVATRPILISHINQNVELVHLTNLKPLPQKEQEQNE